MSAPAFRGYSTGMRARTILCLLALATLFRALVPVGYMPDAAALRQGRLEISFCPAAGGAPTGLRAPIDTVPHDAHPDDAAAQDCPPWLVVHPALDRPPSPH